MKRSVLSKLSSLINENGNALKIEAYEEVVIECIEDAVKEDEFYSLPMKEILKILSKCVIADNKLLCEIVSRTSEKKGDESVLLLNVLHAKCMNRDDFVNIVSKFKCSPLCAQMNEILNEEHNLANRCFEYETGKQKKDIEKLKKENREKLKEVEKLKKIYEDDDDEKIDFSVDL